MLVAVELVALMLGILILVTVLEALSLAVLSLNALSLADPVIFGCRNVDAGIDGSSSRVCILQWRLPRFRPQQWFC